MTAVLVLVERDGASVRKPTLELLTIARRLGEPVAVVCGPAEPALTEVLARYGATAVYACTAAELDEHGAGPKAEVLAEVVRQTAPAAVLITSGAEGKEIAARIAVGLGSGIITDAVDVQPGSDGPVATQSVFAGSWTVQSQVRRGTPVLTVRPNAARPEPVDTPTEPAVEQVAVVFSDAARGARVVSRRPKAKTGRPDITDAAIVVTGGRGVGSAEAFTLIEALADATRTIVAINKDPKAPIFQIADFGVVGDLHAILPALINEIEKRKG